jgi:hypothetical protein
MRRYPPIVQGPHTGWSPQRDRAAQARFRKALIRRSCGRCEWPGCTTPHDRPQAHHDRAGYTPDCGRYLCWTHHKHEDPYAR